MSISTFADKTHPPDEVEIDTILGSKLPLWRQITQFLSANYPFERLLNFGGKNYGWTWWYRKNGKTLVTLYPQENGFTVQLVLGKVQVEKAMVLNLGSTMRRKLEETPQLHDGKWLFVPVESQQDVDDLSQLIRVKQRPRPD